MSDEIFPTLRGLSWDITKSPEFFTISTISPTGLEVNAIIAAFPRWRFSMTYEFLREEDYYNGKGESELKKLLGFFLKRHGNVDDFLYLDPSDYYVNNQIIGYGNGINKKFQLCRSYGGYTEPVYGIKKAPVIMLNNIPTNEFEFTPKGTINFLKPPPAGATISWNGEFYYRVRFNEPAVELNNFAINLWEGGVEFTSVKRIIT